MRRRNMSKADIEAMMDANPYPGRPYEPPADLGDFTPKEKMIDEAYRAGQRHAFLLSTLLWTIVYALLHLAT